VNDPALRGDKGSMDAARRFVAELLDVLFPPACAACGAPAPGWPELFCGPCALALEPAPSPVPASRGDPHEALHSPFAYGGPIAAAIVDLKHGDRPSLAPGLARIGIGLCPPPAADVVVPVPLHPRRLARRGFNQSALLARPVARAAHGRLSHALDRVRDTPTQGGLSAAGRRANVRGAFAVARPRAVAGRSVLVVDDVWTTGATARACARALVGAGARTVWVWTLARVA
jgi:ComF family protein